MKKILMMLVAIFLVAGCTSAPSTEDVSKTGETKTYTGKGSGMGGELSVDVTVSEDEIISVKVTSQNETYGAGYGMPTCPVELIPQLIVENQSVDVDTISGATISSNAVLNAVNDALSQAGMSDLFHGEIAEKEVETEYTTDVIVVGGGAAGLSAALAAKENGAEVILIEKQGITGGSTTLSGGKTAAAGTKYQENQEIVDSADIMYEYMMSRGNDSADPEFVRLFCDQSASAIDWMNEHGVEFQDVERIHVSIPEWRVHNVAGGSWMVAGKGGGIIVPLTESATASGVTMLYNTAGTDLIVEDGKIVGVKAMHNDTEITIHANAVVLATGGFGFNTEKVDEYMNTYADFNGSYIAQGGCGNTGDGIEMAASVNAEVNYTAGGGMTYSSFGSGVGVGEEAGLMLDKTGVRVCNEYSYQFLLSSEMMKHDSNKAWYVTDIDDPYPNVQKAIENGVAVSTESVEELAEKTGMDKDILASTLAKYNASCQNGVDEEFGKPSEYLNEITGTLYAIEMNASFSFTFGGIRTNTNAEVLDVNGNAISGLYAAGETAFTSLLGDAKGINYPECGTAIGNAVVFGKIAGENAANYK